MTNGPIGRSPDVELGHSTLEQQPILANPLRLYCYDFSEFVDIEIRIDGKFPFDSLALYWTEPYRHPFLVTVSGVPARFALVKRAATSTDFRTIWDMAEFFIVRRCKVRRFRLYMRLAMPTPAVACCWLLWRAMKVRAARTEDDALLL
jgi:predicted acetyltransferase